MTLRALASTILVATLGAALHGQAPQTQNPDLAKEAVVIERMNISIAFEADGSRTSESELRVRIQSAGALQQLGTIAVPYSREYATLDFLYVRVRKPDGTLVETPVTAALEVPADVTRDAPTYSDIFLKHINVQGLAVGDTLDYAFRIHERSLIPGEFWLEHTWTRDVVTLGSDLTVSFPATMTPTIKSLDPQPVIREDGGRRIYTWHHANLAPLDEKASQLEAYANRDRRASVQISSFRDWVAVGDAIRTLWHGRADVTPAIREKARELIQGARTDVERLQALHTFVSTNVRYVAVSLGIGRLQPHAASEVLTNGFGDCKDKHTLLVALLKSIGIDAEAVLIGPGEPMDPAVPSPGQFDHVITFVPGVGGGTWLDTTLEVAAAGQLAATERDRQALLIPGTDRSRITRTPEASSRGNLWTSDLVGTLDDKGTLNATVRETFAGDSELAARQVFRAVPQARWPELARQFWLVQRFGGTASDVVVSSPEDTVAPFQLTYRFTKEKYSAWDDHEIQAPHPATLPVLPDGSDPVVPFDWGPTHTVRSSSRIELPQGFDARLRSGTPPEIQVDDPAFSYRVRNTLTGRIFESSRDVSTKVKELPVAQFAAYRAKHDSIGNSPFTVVLQAWKPWAWGDPATVDWYGGTRAETSAVLGKAAAAARKEDYQEALRLLRPLARAEPDTPSVGVLLGWTLIQSGDLDGGLSALRAQMSRTPTPSGFKRLAISLKNAGRSDEALTVWRRAYARFPDDRELPLLLGEHLVEARLFEEAVPILQSQIDTQRGSSRLLWNLGKALRGSGKTEAALSTYDQALAIESTPSLLNSIAWDLAEAKVGLTPALGYAERAVRATEEGTATVELSGLDSTRLRMMDTLAAYWDTLAWAHFGLGHLDRAEHYMRPAWDLAQQGAYAEHMAQIREAQGDRNAAAEFYALALVADRPEGAASARLQALLPDPQARAAVLSSAPTTLVARRTVTVPAIATITGRAVVFLRLGPSGTVDDVRFVSGDAAMRAPAEMLRTAKLPSAVPDGSGVRIIRRGILTCSPGAPTCELVLTPVNQVTSVN